MLQAYAKASPQVKFLNYNQDYEHDAKLFFDPIHMNAAGQKAITERWRTICGRFIEQPHVLKPRDQCGCAAF